MYLYFLLKIILCMNVCMHVCTSYEYSLPGDQKRASDSLELEMVRYRVDAGIEPGSLPGGA